MNRPGLVQNGETKDKMVFEKEKFYKEYVKSLELHNVINNLYYEKEV